MCPMRARLWSCVGVPAHAFGVLVLFTFFFVTRVDIEDFFAEVSKHFRGGDNDGVNWARIGVSTYVSKRRTDHDLDHKGHIDHVHHISVDMICCAGPAQYRSNPRKHPVDASDHADRAAPTRHQRDL